MSYTCAPYVRASPASDAYNPRMTIKKLAVVLAVCLLPTIAFADPPTTDSAQNTSRTRTGQVKRGRVRGDDCLFRFRVVLVGRRFAPTLDPVVVRDCDDDVPVMTISAARDHFSAKRHVQELELEAGAAEVCDEDEHEVQGSGFRVQRL